MSQTIRIRCSECQGTGLFVGMAERDGFAVVCYRCKGTGVTTFTFEPFVVRNTRPDVRRVIRVNPGILVGGLQPERFGGISYEDWWAGRPFPPGSEMRRYVCPAWWYQIADPDKKPQWRECEVGCGCGGPFSDCSSFGNKGVCWARWDKEFGDKR